MLASSPVALMMLVLLAGVSAVAQSRHVDCEASISRIELTAEPTEKVQQVCISPEMPTTFRFDSPLAPDSVELQDRESFEDMTIGARGFTIIPSASLHAGESFKVSVRFADGAAPTRATFELVGHPALGAQQVRVFRHKRTVEDYQRENQEERKKSQQFAQELKRMRIEHGPGGLTGLLASELIVGEQVVEAKDITRGLVLAPSNPLVTKEVTSYRSNTHVLGVVRVAVAVNLKNPNTQPWMVKDVALVDGGRKAMPVRGVWQPSPISLDQVGKGLVVVELEMTAQEARGVFTLRLWDESEKRLVTLGNVTFP